MEIQTNKYTYYKYIKTHENNNTQTHTQDTQHIQQQKQLKKHANTSQINN